VSSPRRKRFAIRSFLKYGHCRVGSIFTATEISHWLQLHVPPEDGPAARYLQADAPRACLDLPQGNFLQHASNFELGWLCWENVSDLERVGSEEVTCMSDLVVIAFPTEAKAEEVRQKLLAMQKEYLIELGDAVIAVKDAQGRIKLNQLINTTAVGAVSGAFWGSLIGLIFLMPLAGAAIGAASGTLGGYRSDIGIDDKWMKDIAAAIQPSTAALFVLVRKVTADKVLEGLKGEDGTVVKTSLDHNKKTALRAALAGVQAAVPAPPLLIAAPDKATFRRASLSFFGCPLTIMVSCFSRLGPSNSHDWARIQRTFAMPGRGLWRRRFCIQLKYF
jgi:uncharacterized membrane protein